MQKILVLIFSNIKTARCYFLEFMVFASEFEIDFGYARSNQSNILKDYLFVFSLALLVPSAVIAPFTTI